MNWKALPFSKILLIVAGGVLFGVTKVVPDGPIHEALLVAAGALAGWAKRSPGDAKKPT